MNAPLVLGEWRSLPGAQWPQQRAEVRRGGTLVGVLARLHFATSVNVFLADGTPLFTTQAVPRSTNLWVELTSFSDVDTALAALERSLGGID